LEYIKDMGEKQLPPRALVCPQLRGVSDVVRAVMPSLFERMLFPQKID